MTPKRRWLITFLFGLVHGFGFSFALRETLQFAGGHLLTSLLAFNLGVEFGQLLVIGLLVGVLSILFRYSFPERAGTILLSAYVAHIAWHWTVERWGAFRLYSIEWAFPSFDLNLLAVSMRWGMLVMIIVTLVWLMSMVFPQMERDSKTG